MRQVGSWLVAACAMTFSAPSLGAQSVVTHTPSMNGTWLPAPGVLQFNFLHRFSRGSAPERRISSSPTFLGAVRVPYVPAMVGVMYASSSDVVARMPNEWEYFVRALPLGPGHRVVDASVELALNQGARSVDGELTLSRRLGPLRALAAGRVFSNAFDAGEARSAFAAGLMLYLTRYLALSGDWATLVRRTVGERPAWSAGVQLGVPSTPHSLSVHVSNVTTTTLEGASRGSPQVRLGFEYTVRISLPRLGGDPPEADEAARPRDSTFAAVGGADR
jgi:hypothetical protein